jgi:hypothetical protein
MGETEERTLRAKYLDWCSARVAEQFLDLSSEEIYALSHRTGEGSPEPGGEERKGGEESYRVLVQRATEVLLERMSLPPFEEWRRLYAGSPAQYDAEMLGFWRDVSGGSGERP